jgi:uncharacterized protein YukE
MSRWANAGYRSYGEQAGDRMNELLGSDPRRVDVIAERFRGYSQDIQDLQTMAHGAVAEMRNAWCGQDFEGVAQRWERDAGPRLTDVSSALGTMASSLRAQAQEQRRASGDFAGSSVLVTGPHGTPGGLPGGGAGTLVDTTVASVAGDDDSYFAASVGTVEAGAHTSFETDSRGNRTASTSVMAGVYAAYVTGGVSAGNDFANVGAAGTAYAGAEARADASGSIGPDGASGHLGAQAFLGVSAVGNVSAAVAGLSVGAVATARAGAEARADASGSIGLDGARGQLGVGAFAGAKAGADVSGTVAGVTATAGAEVSYGIGAHADVSADLSATNVGVSVDVGATLGLGAGVSFDVSVNPQEAIESVGHAVEGIGDAADDIGDSVGSALSSLARW